MSPTLAITGSTGALGGLVARELAAGGVPLRLLVREVAKAPALAGAVAHPYSYGDRAAAELALAGVQTLFMVSGHEGPGRLDEHRTFIDAARAAGVRHVVYTSFFGASANCTFTLGRDHFHTEQYLRESGMQFTFLRDNFYMDLLEHFADADGVIRGPAGEGRAAFVARADVARTAAAVLRDPAPHAAATYDLTGPESLTLAEVAQALTAATGRPFSFLNETVPEAYASRAVWNAPEWQVDSWVSTYTAFAAGELDGPSDDIERVTGTRPATFAEYLAGRAAA